MASKKKEGKGERATGSGRLSRSARKAIRTAKARLAREIADPAERKKRLLETYASFGVTDPAKTLPRRRKEAGRRIAKRHKEKAKAKAEKAAAPAQG